MWKIFVGFIAFALLALFLIMKGGDKVDMQGEAAGHSTSESASASTPAAATASVPVPAASAPAAATPAASAASTDAQPGKMSTTGTVVVGVSTASTAASK